MLSLGPGLFLAAFITLFYPVARLDGLRFVKRITRCSSSEPRCQALADSLLWQETSKLSHYGHGLWQPEPPGKEKQMSCVSQGKITLSSWCCSVYVCACRRVLATPVKRAYHSYISCSWLLCSTLLTSGIPERMCSEDFKRVACQMSNGCEFRAWKPSDISFQNWAGVPSIYVT